MALSRLGTRGRYADVTWPGFVDALASLLMVFVFVLMVFVLIQANLSWRVSGQDASLSRLRAELSALTGLLNLEREENAALSGQLAGLGLDLERMTERRDALAAELAGLQASLLASQDDTARLSEQLAAAGQLRARLEAELAAANSQIAGLENRVAEFDGQLAAANKRLDQTEAELASQRDQLAMRDQQLATANNASKEAKAEIDRLIAASLALRDELNQLRGLLAEREKQAAEDKVAIAALGQQLNAALASRVQELQLIRSEFFAQLRDILSRRADIQIVGDRFVFQSEVLFAPGAADINPAGQAQLADIGKALMDIAAEIPADVPWVLQVDGHTDTVPVGGRYTDNWDLSTERALSVVRFLVSQGLPANRLAATGYGEFQPIDRADTKAARQKNRRIELKLTRRLANAGPPN